MTVSWPGLSRPSTPGRARQVRQSGAAGRNQTPWRSATDASRHGVDGRHKAGHDGGCLVANHTSPDPVIWTSAHERVRTEADQRRRRLPLSGDAGDADACRQHGDLQAAGKLSRRLLRGFQGADRLAAAPRADAEVEARADAARHRQSDLGRRRPVRSRPPHLPRRPARAARPRDARTPGRLDARQTAQPRAPAVGVLCLRGPA